MRTAMKRGAYISGFATLFLVILVLAGIPGSAAMAANSPGSALDRSVSFHIDAQPLSSGLLEFSDQSGVQVVSRTSLVSGSYTNGVHGRLSIREGLGRLLAQTGLSYMVNADRTISLVKAIAMGDPHTPGTIGASITDPSLTVAAAQSDGQANSSAPPAEQLHTQQSPNQKPAVVTLGTVSVTGTRIKQTSIQTAQPITVITASQIQQSGFVTVSQVLENVTQSGDLQVPESNVDSPTLGGDATAANLRYFGSDRVLLLVDGKRWPTRNLSTIPVSMIDHVEILQDGASAIYGSDAITGVINVILKTNFSGAEASAYMGMYDNDYGGLSGWDGKTQSYSFTIGNQGAKGGIVVNAEYQENDEIWARDRAQSTASWYTNGNELSLNEPGFYEIQSPELANAKLGQATCSASGTCKLGLVNFPENNPTLANFSNESSDNYFDNYWLPILPPQDTSSIFFHTHYAITDNVTFKSLASYSDENASINIEPGRMLFGTTGIYTDQGQGIGIGANNPYNPFGVDLVGNESQYCPDGKMLGGVPVASCTPNYLLTSYARQTVEWGTRVANLNTTNFNFRMGLNGFFDALDSEWDWEVESSYGRNNDTNVFPFGFESNSLVASQFDSPGAVPCNGPAQSAPGNSGTWQEINGKYYQILAPGCVPMNPFGGYNGATGQGSITPAMIAYSQVPDFNQTKSTIRDYTGDITGTLAQLPAGPLDVDVGGEALEENDSFQSDSIDIDKNADHNSSNPYAGRIWTHAEYFEFNIPLLANVPLAKSLTVDLANRWSQFSWEGEEPETSSLGVKSGTHASTGRAQIRWQTSDSLLLRGSWSQGFRTPSVEDLFVAAQANTGLLKDPCAPASANGSWAPPAPLPVGCDGVIHSQSSDRILTLTGGNPSLQPETAITHSFGFVYSPDWLSGFNVSADYYKIDLNNVIGTNGATTIMDECYFQNDPLFCSRITLTGNAIASISETPQNLGEEYSNGVDLAASYILPPTSIGNFQIATNWTFVRSFVAVTTDANSPTGFQAREEAGYVSIPKAKGNLTVNWDMGNWSANWRVSYIGKMWDECTSAMISLNWCSDPRAVDPLSDTQGMNHLGTTIYHDVALTYHVDPINTSFTLGIQNVFNKQFPAAQAFGANNMVTGVGYRIPGRFVYGRIGVKF